MPSSRRLSNVKTGLTVITLDSVCRGYRIEESKALWLLESGDRSEVLIVAE